MTGTERKRAWRQRHPERSRTAERQRAQKRRNQRDGGFVLGVGWVGTSSYQRYESSLKRSTQRHFYPRIGAGSTRLTHKEGSALARARNVARLEDAKAIALAQFPDMAKWLAECRLGK